MEVYVKESLHVLDYKDNVVDSIFLSDDHMTPGYAYDITVTEANTGYSDLKFNMPNMIIDDEGNKVHNPKLKLLTPLVKLRYHREVYYRGDKEITQIPFRYPQRFCSFLRCTQACCFQYRKRSSRLREQPFR